MTRCQLLAPFAVVAITCAFSFVHVGEPKPFERKGAELALDHLREWAKWMTGIEAGGLGGLTALIFVGSDRNARVLSSDAQFFGWSAFVLLGAALIVSAWVFAGLSSIALRIYRSSPAAEPTNETPASETPASETFDIFQLTIFGGNRSMRLGVITTWHHWLWALGLLALGGFALSLLTTTMHCVA